MSQSRMADGIECVKPWFSGTVSGVVRDVFSGEYPVSFHLMPAEKLPCDLWIQITAAELEKLSCRTPEYRNRMILVIRQTAETDAWGRNYEIVSAEYQTYTPPDLSREQG